MNPSPPALPKPRGPLSECLLRGLRTGETGGLVTDHHPAGAPVRPSDDEDLQLALYCSYELHYRGFDGVAEELEWDPDLLAFRAGLEDRFLEELLVEHPGTVDADRAVDALRELATTSRGPSLSKHLAGPGTADQLREFCIHRSAYQLKEADPHTWAIPRLAGRAKAAMVQIQSDEYGEGIDGEMHAQLFADTLLALGLNPAYGAYLDRIPAPTLATVNLVSLLGLHRRWRGALVGHLALFEMTSVVPMGRYSDALARAGIGPAGRKFYDVHVVVDEVHQVVALDDLVAGFLEAEPGLAGDVVFGATVLSTLEGRLTNHLLDAWEAEHSSLRPVESTGDAPGEEPPSNGGIAR